MDWLLVVNNIYLKKIKYTFFIITVLLSIGNVVLFIGEWRFFYTIIILHGLCLNWIHAYIFGRDMVFGGGSVNADGNRVERLLSFIVCMVIYFMTFLYRP